MVLGFTFLCFRKIKFGCFYFDFSLQKYRLGKSMKFDDNNLEGLRFLFSFIITMIKFLENLWIFIFDFFFLCMICYLV